MDDPWISLKATAYTAPQEFLEVIANHMIAPTHEEGRQRVLIEGVKPEIDAGRFPAKRIVGDLVRVEADIFTDGHDAMAAVLRHKPEAAADWTEVRMLPIVNDRWFAEFRVLEIGRHLYTVVAWIDQFDTWRRDLSKRIKASQDADVDYRIGADLISAAAGRALAPDKEFLEKHAAILHSDTELTQKRAAATQPMLQEVMDRFPDRALATSYERELALTIDPPHARFSAWYELFPRSTATQPGQHGTFADLQNRLSYVADLGFDVVYLPPIHPIGVHFRKGRNNAPEAEPGDEGSPWAIGGVEGGHKSIHPKLGTIDDFDQLVAHAKQLGLRIALDVAFQVSPDHPYVKEHENWFRKRPDGTIQYAENPPKKYQDIYPFDFETSDWAALWNELKSVFLYWIEHGITIFRVDNPHTKAFPFWEWAITEIKKEHPEALFLAEAFTRPKIMYRLAKLGFNQSYTYFPWRNTKYELTTYLTDLTKTEVREFFRPNQWPNTPDILTEFLQTSGKPGFMMRLILAATLGANYGLYGPAFELLEARPRHHGSEEYLDSEKYEVRHWDLNAAHSIRELLTAVNRIRRDNPALHNDWSLEFHPIDNDQLICYSKQSDDLSNLILVVVNLDPHYVQSGFLHLPLEKFNIEPTQHFQAHDLLTGARYLWNGPRNYVEVNPQSVPAHVFRIRRRLKTEADFEYFL